MRTPVSKTIITCAITGNLTRPDQTPYLPITPEQIATSALDAADAGAAIVHIHVRDPRTGHPSMDLALYREVMERVRDDDPELIINLTTGPGGRFVPSEHDPRVAAPGSTLMLAEKRVAHIAALKPDICTLDLNTMNSGGQVVINTPSSVRRMATIIDEARVTPEIELFDSGDIALMRDLIAEGVLKTPVLTSFVMGVKYGFQPSPETVIFARNLLPEDALFTAIGIGRSAFQMVAMSYLAGGHVRVGLEDSIYLGKGVLAPSNAAMVLKAREIVEHLGGHIATPAEARAMLALKSHAAAVMPDAG